LCCVSICLCTKEFIADKIAQSGLVDFHSFSSFDIWLTSNPFPWGKCALQINTYTYSNISLIITDVSWLTKHYLLIFTLRTCNYSGGKQTEHKRLRDKTSYTVFINHIYISVNNTLVNLIDIIWLLTQLKMLVFLLKLLFCFLCRILYLPYKGFSLEHKVHFPKESLTWRWIFLNHYYLVMFPDWLTKHYLDKFSESKIPY
jgi:hypothetical protein